MDVVVHFNRLGIHAAHYAVHMAHDTAHHVIHDGWLTIQQRFKFGAFQQQHFAVGVVKNISDIVAAVLGI